MRISNHYLFGLVLGLSLTGQVLAVDYVQGVDVSHYQGSINWAAAKGAGIQFAFAKATEGVDFVDDRFIANMNGARAAGVLIGPYHFARLNSGETNASDAVNEANDFVDAIEPFYQQYPSAMLRPVLDLENLPDDPVSPSVKAYVSKWTRDFNQRVKDRLGFIPIVYTGGNFAQNYVETNINQFPLWFAKPTSTNVFANASLPTASNIGVWSDWTFWQWSWVGQVSGISGDVDRDVYKGTLQQLKQQFGAVPEPDGFALAAILSSILLAVGFRSKARLSWCRTRR